MIFFDLPIFDKVVVNLLWLTFFIVEFISLIFIDAIKYVIISFDVKKLFIYIWIIDTVMLFKSGCIPTYYTIATLWR